MKRIERKNHFALLLIGLVVMILPLWFFNSLLKNALETAKESSLAYLREDILQTAENVRNLSKPAVYVKEAIEKIHSEVLPEITPDIVKMRPDLLFGQDQFNSELPGKLLAAMHRHRLDAIQIVVNPPEFADVYYWNCAELKRQCPEEDNLAYDHTINNFYSSGSLYQQYFQKNWHRLYSLPPFLSKILQIKKSQYLFAYLSRISQLVGPHDRVREVFTDYFGQQSIYAYSYVCVSAVNCHGAYTMILPQNSINPGEIIRNALQYSRPGIAVSLVHQEHGQQGIKETADGLEFHTGLPSEFWNHYYFKVGVQKGAAERKRGDWQIKVSGELSQSFFDQQKDYQLFRLLAAFGLMVYGLFSFRLLVNGIQTGVSVRFKLSLFFALIVLLPIMATGILTSITLRTTHRVVENRILQQTLNGVKKLAILNDENQLRRMVAVLELKRRFAAIPWSRFTPAAFLNGAEDFGWFSRWTGALSIGLPTGECLSFQGIMEPIPASRLISSLLRKYMDSLGLSEIKKNGSDNSISGDMTMGLLENLMTPEMEEAWMINESTIQREITQTSDTVRAALLLIRDSAGNYRLLYTRVSYGAPAYSFLSWYSNNLPDWFRATDAYSDLSLAVTLRRSLDLSMYAWPPDAFVDTGMREVFGRAFSLRDSGQNVIRNGNDFEVKCWRYTTGEAAVIAGIGRSKGAGFIAFAASMVLPLLIGYALLILYFITHITASFIREPARIIGQGVEALKEGSYGVKIADFSGQEFQQMTRAFNEMSQALRQRELMKRYVSKKLVQQMQGGQTARETAGGQLFNVAVLASDIRGFTSISEKYSPAEIVEMLNSYFTRMEKAILEHGGIIDKYIGDAVQAIFYPDSNLENATVRACRAAISMRTALQEFNTERSLSGLFTVENGIGIDTGMVISGSIGSSTGRKDYTVVGSVVEKAAAVEAMTTGSTSKILLSLAALQATEKAVTTKSFSYDAVELTDV